MNTEAIAKTIYDAADPVLVIKGLGGGRWKRKVTKGSRIGPWLQADYKVLDEDVWYRRGACLYLVGASDGRICYVGISRNGLKHRWRTSPAYDAKTMERLSENQLFHSQCWKPLEGESVNYPNLKYEVRSIEAASLVPVLTKLGPPLSALTLFGSDGEGIVAAVERWLCNNKSSRLAVWNTAMGKK